MTSGAAGALRRCLLVVLAALLLLAPGFSAEAAVAAVASSCTGHDGPPAGAVGADHASTGLQAAERHDQHRSGTAKAAPVRAQRRAPAGPGVRVGLPPVSTSGQPCASTAFTRRGPPHSGD